MLKIRPLKARGSCAGRYNKKWKCPIGTSWDAHLKKGTEILEVMGNIRYCPSCTLHVLSEFESGLRECREHLKAEEAENISCGISLLRDDD